MKRITYITLVLMAGVVAFSSCGNKRNPGRTYMPDMAYSRAMEAYADVDTTKFTMDATNKGNKIFYNAMPPAGTIKRGDFGSYTLPNDSNGYKMSSAVRSPLDTVKLSKEQLGEAGRLYDINCGICHGAKGAGNGPIADKIGAVANLTLPNYVAMSDGTMFHSITYGKGNMGSYASQLTREQRWQVIKYVRTLQPAEAGASAAAGTATATAAGTASATATAAGGTTAKATDTTKK